ncbi:hypothetical protein Bca4012_080115 [Brassica carinata]
MKTKAHESKPRLERRISSLVGCNVLLTQPAAEISSLVTLPGCFLNTEYKVKKRKQRPRLIPTQVKSAERIITPKFLKALQKRLKLFDQKHTNKI